MDDYIKRATKNTVAEMLAIEVPADVLDTREFEAKAEETSNSILPYKCLMLHELLANDPTHYLWKTAPTHILGKASNLNLSSQG